jgi:hypothetical protein
MAHLLNWSVYEYTRKLSDPPTHQHDFFLANFIPLTTDRANSTAISRPVMFNQATPVRLLHIYDRNFQQMNCLYMTPEM